MRKVEFDDLVKEAVEKYLDEESDIVHTEVKEFVIDKGNVIHAKLNNSHYAGGRDSLFAMGMVLEESEEL